MINIVICDDERVSLRYNQVLVEEFFNKTNAKYKILFCTNETQLTSLIESTRLDIAVLDIDLCETINGIDLAKRISDFNPNCILIFITCHPEFALDAFGVRAFGFIQKPVKESEFNEVFGRVVHQLNGINMSKTQHSFEIKANRMAYLLNESEVYYIEKKGQKLEVCTKEATYYVYETLKSIQERLSDNFIKIHSGLMINKKNIQSISSKSVTLKNNRQISINRKQYREIQAIDSKKISI